MINHRSYYKLQLESRNETSQKTVWRVNRTAFSFRGPI